MARLCCPLPLRGDRFFGQVFLLRYLVVSGTSFEGAAAVKLAVEASGAITNFTILEEMDMGKASEMAAKAMSNYKPAG